MTLSYTIDCIVVIMLVINIIYSWRLNKKIIEFRSSKFELISLIQNLDASINKAEYSVEELKRVTSTTSIDLNHKIDKAKFLADDLAFMTDRASVLADKLEEAIANSRNTEKLSNTYREPYKPHIQVAPKPTTQSYEPPKPLVSSKQIITPEKEPNKKVAIESLLARISAVKNSRKETI